jgi:transcription-repair coupling factor (superfamily II helicase)
MLVKDFLKLYREDGVVQTISEQTKNREKYPHIQLKGLSGSLDAVIASAIHQLNPKQDHLFILEDREEAAYFSTTSKVYWAKKFLCFFQCHTKRPINTKILTTPMY